MLCCGITTVYRGIGKVWRGGSPSRSPQNDAYPYLSIIAMSRTKWLFGIVECLSMKAFVTATNKFVCPDSYDILYTQCTLSLKNSIWPCRLANGENLELLMPVKPQSHTVTQSFIVVQDFRPTR